MNDEQELKQRLAVKHGGIKLVANKHRKSESWCWNKRNIVGGFVRNTEWDYIARMVEDLMHPDKRVDYVLELEQSFRREENKHFGDKPEKKFPFNEFGRFEVLHAPWPLRATAMCEIGFI